MLGGEAAVFVKIYNFVSYYVNRLKKFHNIYTYVRYARTYFSYVTKSLLELTSRRRAC